MNKRPGIIKRLGIVLLAISPIAWCFNYMQANLHIAGASTGDVYTNIYIGMMAVGLLLILLSKVMTRTRKGELR